MKAKLQAGDIVIRDGRKFTVKGPSSDETRANPQTKQGFLPTSWLRWKLRKSHNSKKAAMTHARLLRMRNGGVTVKVAKEGKKYNVMYVPLKSK